MASKVLSATVIGLDCAPVEVEADHSPHGTPGLFIVGLPDKAVDESKSRVRSAVKNSDLDFPRGNVTINLAPADIKKFGTYHDVPIALSCLVQAKQLSTDWSWNQAVFVGELALDGSVRSVPGVLSIALDCYERQIKELYVPVGNAGEAALVDGLAVYAFANLRQLVDHIRGEKLLSLCQHQALATSPISTGYDLATIKGQEHVKRALEIAAAGSHNILMAGPPGSGKTLLAKALPTILPVMTWSEQLEVTRIYSAAGALPGKSHLMSTRPFRSPHHTASGVALVGGGAWPRPGEISLAHRGVLFLDEFLEFPKVVLDNLRQPLEDGIITVSRASGTVIFPARFVLVAAMNPCPCGYLTDLDHRCVCAPGQILKYQKRASGPLLDRIDLHIDVPRLSVDKLSDDSCGESSAVIQKRVQRARDIQQERLASIGLVCNSEMNHDQLKKYCTLTPDAKTLLFQAVDRLHLSARSYHRIIKLARTIADLAGQEVLDTAHIAESLQYRSRLE